MKSAKKLLLTSTLFLALGVTSAHAASDNMDAQVVTRTAVNVNVDTNMNFGRIDVVIATQDGTVRLAPTGNGVTVTGGTAGTVVTSGGTPASGQVTITTDGASNIDVTCNTTAALDNGAGDELALSNVQIEATAGATLAATTCDGTPTSVSPTAADVVLGVGADIVLDPTTNTVAVGTFTYDTNTGGTPLTITAVYP